MSKAIWILPINETICKIPSRALRQRGLWNGCVMLADWCYRRTIPFSLGWFSTIPASALSLKVSGIIYENAINDWASESTDEVEAQVSSGRMKIQVVLAIIYTYIIFFPRISK